MNCVHVFLCFGLFCLCDRFVYPCGLFNIFRGCFSCIFTIEPLHNLLRELCEKNTRNIKNLRPEICPDVDLIAAAGDGAESDLQGAMFVFSQDAQAPDTAWWADTGRIGR